MNLNIRPSVNLIGQTRKNAKNSQQNQSFGMYVKMDSGVAKDLMEKAKRLDTVNNNIIVEAGHLVQRIYRDIINHNIESNNHAIYDDIAEITNITVDSSQKNLKGFLISGKIGGTEKTPRCGSFGVTTNARYGSGNFYPNDTNLASEIQNQIIFSDRFGGREECVINHLAEQAAKTLPKDISPKLPRLWDNGPIYNPKDL